MKNSILFVFIVSSFMFIIETSAQTTEFWGTTMAGGEHNSGTVFKTDNNGENIEIVFSFPIETPGKAPQWGRLCLASNGNLYGTTYEGGANNYGVLFEYNPLTEIYTVLYEFVDSELGCNPDNNLIQAANGNLYGTLSYSGSYDLGVLFEFDLATNTYSKKIDFDGMNLGTYPNGVLIEITDNVLIGITTYGGTNDLGVLFEYNITTNTYLKKYEFIDGENGSVPGSSICKASNNKIYGVTQVGGANNYGVFYEFDLDTDNYTKKFDFDSDINGAPSFDGLMEASNGKIYGISYSGGLNGDGFIYNYDLLTETLTKISDFDNTTSGKQPCSALVETSNGKLYGTTSSGGLYDNGVVFEFDLFTNILVKKLDFDGLAYGRTPRMGFSIGNNGKLYGATRNGGINDSGTLFEYDPEIDTIIRQISFNSTLQGKDPHGSLVQIENGMIYGMTNSGGMNNSGVIFEINPTTHDYSKIFDFNPEETGSMPYGNLMQASNGNLYGMTKQGGAFDFGTVFEINPENNEFTKKLDFDGGELGGKPYGSLIQASNGKLYGVNGEGGEDNCGVIFEFDLVENSFTPRAELGDINAYYVFGSLLEANDGKLYGLSFMGGFDDGGLIFSYNIEENSILSLVEFEFCGIDLGSCPYGNLVQSANGKIYGITSEGGINNDGTLFEFNPDNLSCTKLADFSEIMTGLYPMGSPMIASNGNIYGMCCNGGISDMGTLFEYNPETQFLTNKINFTGADNGSYPGYGYLIEIVPWVDTDIESQSYMQVASIFPNPADNYLTLDYKLVEKKGDISIVITDVSGKIVYSKLVKGIEDIILIDLKDLPAGTYICSLKNGNDYDFSEKFIKDK